MPSVVIMALLNIVLVLKASWRLTCSADGWQKTVCTASGGKCFDRTSCKRHPAI
jgi:hypothetical protein